MNIIKFELKYYLKNFIGYFLFYSLVLFGYMTFYPSFQSSGNDFIKIIESYPQSVIDAFNINLATILTYDGFLAFTLSFIVIGAAIQAFYLGLDCLAKEKTKGIIDFVLTKPISRIKLYTNKVLAILIILIMNALIMYVLILSNSLIYNINDHHLFLEFAAAFFLLQFIFMAIGLVIGACLQSVKYVLSYSYGLVFFFYFISMLASVLKDHKIKYLTPFQLYEPNYIVANQGNDLGLMMYGIVVAIIFMIIGLIVFNRQEMKGRS